MLDIIKNRKPEIITLNNVKKEIKYWPLSSKEFNELNKNNSLTLIDNLSEPENDIMIYSSSNGLCLVQESANYSLFRSINDVISINENFEPNRSYDLMEDFNHLGERFISITDFSNKELKLLTKLDLDFSLSSLQLLDNYIQNQNNDENFVEKNKLLLLSYLGNVIIKNSKSNIIWSVIKPDDQKYWEPILLDKNNQEQKEISRWFLDYIYDSNSRIIGLEGLYSILTVNISKGEK